MVKTKLLKQNSENKTILKNLEQQFMSVIKLKPNYIIIFDFAKDFGRREWQAEMTASIEH